VLSPTSSIAISEVPTLGSLLINEILFNPRTGGTDYIELINVSDERLDLSEVIVSNSDNNQSVTLSNLPGIEAGQIVLLTADIDQVTQEYPNHDPLVMYQLDIPSMNNDDGNVTLTYRDDILDSYDYDEDHHNALLDDVDGVSLERLDLTQSNDPSNWTSALRSSGYGTPGLPNSVAGEVGQLISIEVTQKIFSPNGDGDKDEATIDYTLDRGDYFTSLTVYNERGILMDRLLVSEPTLASGTWTWDGRIDGSVAPPGIYIIEISLFALDGSTFRANQTVGLGDFLD